MLIQNYTIEYGHLFSGVAQVVSITNADLTREDLHIDRYHPTDIKFPNTTGSTIHIAVFNDWEYTSYQSDPTISDLWAIADNVTDTFSDFTGDKITTILVSGVAGDSYDTNLTISVIQD